MEADPVLAIVIPVYNEEENIGGLIRDWEPVFRQTGVSFRIMLIDDGSTDHSADLMNVMQAYDPNIFVHSQPNAGHGPAILKGYQMALDAEWIFQIDADHQFDTGAFAKLWENRSHYDLLLAERKEKKASLTRKCISLLSMLFVRNLYGRGVTDVNCPYRLMRSVLLQEAMTRIKPGSFAPNILLTAWFVRKKRRIFTTVAEPRTTDVSRPSKMNLYLLRGSVRSAWQTILFRIRR